MNPSLASLLCACGIAGLFYLNRDRSVHTSRALWLPVFYVFIQGSRSVSQWLGVNPPEGTNVQLEGSPLDAVVYAFLLAAALVVLIRRGRQPFTLLAANWPILTFFAYCLISVTWADFPAVALKRWIKATIDVVIVLIIVTDVQPVAAIRRLISRVGFILFPTSVLLIKYYGDFVRVYTVDGDLTNTGVTLNKNSLGLIVMVISLGALWNVRSLIRRKDEPNRGRRMLAQAILLAFGLRLLGMANSATSTACFILGGGLILLTTAHAIRSRPARVHALCLMIILFGVLSFFVGGDANVVHALGRKTNLTGRTEIWAAVLPAVSNSIVGAGFESFWIGSDVQKMRRTMSDLGWWHPEEINEAHNGYIEMYLNLGWIGVGLIALLLINGYRRAGKAFQCNPDLGSLILAYISMGAVYSVTEAGFRELTPSWIFLLLAVVSATAVTRGFFGGEDPGGPGSDGWTVGRMDAFDISITESEAIDGVQREMSLTSIWSHK